MQTRLPYVPCVMCRAPSPHRCGGCGAAKYCSAACQKRHWPVHKAACQVDRAASGGRLAPGREAEVYAVDGNCLHGGPPPSEVAASPVFSTIMALCMPKPCYSPAAALLDLVRFCEAHPQAAADVRTRQVLVAMATDAFSDDEAATTRHIVALVAFLEGFAAEGGGAAFLAAVENAALPVAEQPPSVVAYHALLARAASRTGLISVLRERVTCRCLQPRR